MILQSSLLAGLVTFACLLPCGPAQATDFEGAWATDAANCSKIFVKSAKGVSFAKKADLYGSGFVIAGNKLRGKIASCNIKARKQEGDIVHFVAVCSTDIAIDTMQFSLKILDENKVARVFTAMPELETRYERCRP